MTIADARKRLEDYIAFCMGGEGGQALLTIADLRALLAELDRLSGFVAAVDDLVARPGHLAEMATRIVENIEQVDHWIDDRSLVTAHAHASVLRDDLPIVLAELDRLQGGELEGVQPGVAIRDAPDRAPSDRPSRERWRPIATYPACETCGQPDCDWGPDALLLFPANHYPEGVAVVGHKEAGMWLSRCASEAVAWDQLENNPTHWAPVPETVNLSDGSEATTNGNSGLNPNPLPDEPG